ncbi:MAG: hypothetical protein ABIM99_01770 [Candidatus Dojkabacteria bacterium]
MASDMLDNFLKSLKKDAFDPSKALPDDDKTDEFFEDEVQQEIIDIPQEVINFAKQYPDHELTPISFGEGREFWTNVIKTQYKLDPELVDKLSKAPNMLFIISNIEEEDYFFIAYEPKEVQRIRIIESFDPDK